MDISDKSNIHYDNLKPLKIIKYLTEKLQWEPLWRSTYMQWLPQVHKHSNWSELIIGRAKCSVKQLSVTFTLSLEHYLRKLEVSMINMPFFGGKSIWRVLNCQPSVCSLVCLNSSVALNSWWQWPGKYVVSRLYIYFGR